MNVVYEKHAQIIASINALIGYALIVRLLSCILDKDNVFFYLLSLPHKLNFSPLRQVRLPSKDELSLCLNFLINIFTALLYKTK